MTPQQRSDAARKAAATKRRNAAAARNGGYAPPPPPRPAPPPYTPPPPPGPSNWHPGSPTRTSAFTAPKPTVRNQRLAVVSALEDLFVLVCRDHGITDERRKAFDTYKKALALAVGTVSNQAMQNEADVALRVAAVALVKQVF